MSYASTSSVGRRIASLALIMLILGGTFGAVAGFAVGSATAAATNTATPTASGDGGDTLADEMVDVTNDTESVYIEYGDTNGTLDVTVYGVTEAGIEEQVTTANVSAGANETKTWTYSVTPTEYDRYRVVVKGAGAGTLSVGKIAKVAGGGGMAVGGHSATKLGGIAVLALVVVGGGYLSYRE